MKIHILMFLVTLLWAVSFSTVSAEDFERFRINENEQAQINLYLPTDGSAHPNLLFAIGEIDPESIHWQQQEWAAGYWWAENLIEIGAEEDEDGSIWFNTPYTDGLESLDWAIASAKCRQRFDAEICTAEPEEIILLVNTTLPPVTDPPTDVDPPVDDGPFSLTLSYRNFIHPVRGDIVHMFEKNISHPTWCDFQIEGYPDFGWYYLDGIDLTHSHSFSNMERPEYFIITCRDPFTGENVTVSA